MSPSANAWADVAAFRAWAEGEPRATTILAAEDDALVLVLVAATRRLEQESYVGTRTAHDQALSFPRRGLSRDGIPLDSTTVPPFAVLALFAEALALFASPTRYDPNGLAQFAAVSVGPIAVTPRHEALTPHALTPDAERLLADVRVGGGAGSAMGTFRYLR